MDVKTKKILEKKFSIRFFSCDEFNKCYSAGLNLYIGKYDNLEYELISIFHELGHYFLDKNFPLQVNYNTLLIELECWREGIIQANNIGILFTDDAIQWGIQQALTYVGHDEREYRFFDKSKFWKNNQNIFLYQKQIV